MSRRGKRSRQPAEGQQQIDFDRGAQLAVLREIELPERLTGLGASVSPATAMSVLRAIDDHQRDGSKCWPSLETLAKACKLKSIKTVRRAIAALESLGLLTTWEERDERGWRRKCYRIEWLTVFTWGCEPAPDTASVPIPAREPSASTEQEIRQNSPPMDIVTGPVDIESQPVDIESHALFRTAQEAPTPTANGPLSRPGWVQVEQRLRDLGVKRFDLAVDAARKHVDPLAVLAICDFFETFVRSDEHGPGHLYVRVLTARTWMDPSEGWPEPKAKSSPEVLCDRESRFGSALDAMTDADLVALVERADNVTRQMVRLGGMRNCRQESSTRHRLLRVLEESLNEGRGHG